MTKIQEIPTYKRKMRELILYLTAKSEGDLQFSPAKLNKLLFYCDFTAHRQLGYSITGYSHQKLPSGPTPRAAQRLSYDSELSAEELQLADQVIADLWDSRVDEVSDYSCGSIGYRWTNFNEVIPCATVFLGDPLTSVAKDEIEFCKQLERESE